MNVIRNRKIILLSAIVNLLTGCVVAATGVAEYAAESANEEYIRTGKQLKSIADWKDASNQSTVSMAGGKEHWVCANSTDEKLERDEIRFICLDPTINLDTSENIKFACANGKGTILGVLNKNNTSTIYCKKPKNQNTSTTPISKETHTDQKELSGTNKKIIVNKELILKTQKKLAELGYQSGSADGLMGSKTKVALKKFQEDKGLVSSGEIDQVTLDALSIN